MRHDMRLPKMYATDTPVQIINYMEMPSNGYVQIELKPTEN